MNLRNTCRLAAPLAVAWIAFLAGPAGAAPPVIQCPAPLVTYEQGGVYFYVTASDADGDPITLSVLNPPRRSTFDAPSGYFTWVPDYTQAGSYAVVFRATAGGQTAECTVPITVGNWNRPPRITCPAPLSGTAGDTLRAQLTGTDPDSDGLTFSGISLPPGATISPTGAFTWVTGPFLAAGTYAIQARVSDGGFTVGCSFDVSLYGLIPSPQLTCPTVASVLELDPVDFAVTVIDPSGLQVTVTAQDLPPGSTFDPATRRFLWTPTLAQSGTWAPRFTASNGESVPATCTVPINVLNRAVAAPQVSCFAPQTVTELQTISFTITAVDPLNLPVTYGATGLPAGSVLHPLTGQFSWTPSLTQSGVHDIRFNAANGGATGFCDQRITVLDRAVVPPSIFCPGPQVVFERRTLSFFVAATDPQGQPVTISAPNLPRGAMFDVVLRRFDWTPGPDQSGTYLPRFVAHNGFVTAACTVQVTVLDRAVVAPDVTCPGPLFTAEQRVTSFVVGASDAEGDPLTWTVRGLPPGAVFAPDGRFTWEPDITRAGLWDIEFVASDGEARDSCRVQLQVVDHDATLDPFEPVIAGVRDVPQDQGGWVEVRLVTASADAAPGGQITGYNLWRRLGASATAAGRAEDEGAATLALAADGRVAPGTRLPPELAGLRQFPPGTWQSVAFTPALQSLNLRLLAPTRADSGSGGPPRDVFVVSAHTSAATTWFVGAPDSGYSVDNLAPAAPALRAERSGGDEAVALAWTGSPDLDLAGYEVHKGPDAAFTPGEATLLTATSDTTLLDRAPAPGTWYRIVARDVHGNGAASPAVLSPAVVALPAALRLAAPRPNPARGGVEFSFDLPAEAAVRLVVVDPRGRVVRIVDDGRRGAGIHHVAWDGRDGQGRLVAAGLYVLRLEAGDRALTRKFVRL